MISNKGQFDEDKLALISQINYPSVLKYFESEDKAIFAEKMPNGSLQQLMQAEKMGASPIEYDNTKKLIILYGIASGMEYLHSFGIFHHNLNLENVLLDIYLYPKISNWIYSQDSINPEFFPEHEYTEKTDVFSFAFLAYELITGEKPNSNQKRPDFPSPTIFESLIQRCWEEDPDKRPSFKEISKEFKTDSKYVKFANDIQEYLNYIEYIDDKSEPDYELKPINLENIIIEPKAANEQKETNQDDKSEPICPQDIVAQLSKKGKQLIRKAEIGNDGDSQFKVGVNFIEGVGRYPKDETIGIKYLQKSIENGNEEAALYYVNKLINNDEDIEQANEFISNSLQKGTSMANLLNGLISLKQLKYEEAYQNFNISSSEGSPTSSNQLAIMYRDGLGVTKDLIASGNYFALSEILKNANQSEPATEPNQADQNNNDNDNENNNNIDEDQEESETKNEQICPQEIIDQLSKQSKQLIKKADQENDSFSQYKVGVNFIEGVGRYPKNVTIGTKYMQKAIENGNEGAAFYYVNRLLNTDEDFEKANEFISNNLNEEETITSFVHGLISFKQLKYKEAFQFFNIAHSKGSPGSINQLGIMYKKCLGVKKDPITSQLYFDDSNKTEKNDENDDDDPKNAQFCPQELLEQLSKAAKQLIKKADIENDPVSQYKLGVNFIEAVGKYPKNDDLGIMYLKKSIENGNEEAAVYYVNKLDENTSNVDEFIESHNEDDSSMFDLLQGLIFLKNENYEKAHQFFVEGSNKGSPASALQLSIMYKEGLGVETNDELSSDYLNMYNTLKKHGKTTNDNQEDVKPTTDKICPQEIFDQLSLKGKQTVKKAETENDSALQYKVAVNFFEGIGKYPKDQNLGSLYLQKSIENGNETAAIYYADNAPKFKGGLKNLLKFVEEHSDDDNPLIDLLHGLYLVKQKKYEDAHSFFLNAYKKGNPQASYQLGVLYRDGLGVKQSQKKSSDYFTKAKKMRNSPQNDDSENETGNDEDDDDLIDTNPNPSKDKTLKPEILHAKGKSCLEFTGKGEKTTFAIYFFKLAAEQNYLESMKELINIYRNGAKSIEPNQGKALKYAKMAAGKGDIESMKIAAVLYEKGDEPNKVESFKYYKMAALKGDVDSMYKTGLMLMNSNKTKNYKEKACQFFKLAAEKGNKFAMYKYALMLIDGDGTKADTNKAVSYLQSSASLGNKKAEKKLEELNVSSAKQKTIEKIEVLKEKVGQNDTKAMIKLGRILMMGKGVKKNLKLAEKYFIKAEQLNDPEAKKALKKLKEIKITDSNDPSEMVNYGKSIEFADKKEPNYLDEAMVWYKKAADLNFDIGMVNYARVIDLKLRDYRMANGPKSKKKPQLSKKEYSEAEIEAFSYYKKAADKGNRIAMFHVGLCLEHGNGTDVDKEKAVEFYRKSSLKGYLVAMSNLARCLEHGYGVKQNEKEALRWYKQAMEKGSERAKGEYNYLYLKMKKDNENDDDDIFIRDEKEEEEENDDINNDDDNNNNNEEKEEKNVDVDDDDDDVDENEPEDGDDDDDVDENEPEDGDDDDDVDENEPEDGDDDDDVDENDPEDGDDDDDVDENDPEDGDDDVFDDNDDDDDVFDNNDDDEDDVFDDDDDDS